MLVRSTICTLCWLCLALPQAYGKGNNIVVSGFARLLEEETFLSGAVITVDVFSWNGDYLAAPVKLQTKTIETDRNGFFQTTIKKGSWFRLSLQPGTPPNLEKAMADWVQHAAPQVTHFSAEALALIRFMNSENEKLLYYIGTDSGLMPADKDYVGRNREISFQVPLAITQNIIRKLSISTYGEDLMEDACQLVVTALSPRYESFAKAYPHSCPADDYMPEVQNLFDCPHGASEVRFSSYPESQRIHYFGINEHCKTDILATDLTETTRDGGGILGNIKPPEAGRVAWVRATQKGSELPIRYFLCEPGKVINISPPHGPPGLFNETGFIAKGSPLSFYTVVGILYFALELAGSLLESSGEESEYLNTRYRDEL